MSVPQYDYTTEDEIAYLHALRADGKQETLIGYAAAFFKRSFSGEGMHVDKRAVAKELRKILGPDVFHQQGAAHETDLARMAKEWLGGGNLRALARQNAMADERDV